MYKYNVSVYHNIYHIIIYICNVQVIKFINLPTQGIIGARKGRMGNSRKPLKGQSTRFHRDELENGTRPG